MSERVEERIDEASRLRARNIELQEEIDANESEIEALLSIDALPYEFEAQVALLRGERKVVK
jgi:hypothetical protein